MANYNVLKNAIENAVDWDNNDKQISGNDMLAILLSIVNNTVVAGYLFKGVAEPTTNPGTPDQNVFYVAAIPGTYSNFDGIVVDNRQICILKYNGSWEQELAQIPSIFTTAKLDTQFVDGFSVIAGETTVVPVCLYPGTLTFACSSYKSGYGFIDIKGYDGDDNLIFTISSIGVAASSPQTRTIQTNVVIEKVSVEFAGSQSGKLCINMASSNLLPNLIQELKDLANSFVVENTGKQQIVAPIGGGTYKTSLFAGNVNVQVETNPTATFFSMVFYDESDNVLYEIPSRLIAANSGYLGSFVLTGTCVKIVVGNSHRSGMIINIASENSILELFNSGVPAIKLFENENTGNISFSGKFPTATLDGIFLFSGKIHVVLEPLSAAAFFSVNLYDKDNNIIGSLDAGLVNAGSGYSGDVTTKKPCVKIVFSGSGSTGNFAVTVSNDKNIVSAVDAFDPEAIDPGIQYWNRFDKETRINGKYIDPSGGLANNPDYYASDFIYIGDLESFVVSCISWGAIYDEFLQRIEDIRGSETSDVIFTVPTGGKYVRICGTLANSLNVAQVGQYVSKGSYVPFGQQLTMDKLRIYSNQIVDMAVIEFAISLPSVVYLRTSEEFGIWYRNIIKGSQQYLNGNYSIRCQGLENGTYYGIGSQCTPEKFNYVNDSETSFVLVIKIFETYSGREIATKTINVYVKNPANVSNLSPKIVLLGDSFTDGHNVCKWIYSFLLTDGLSPVAVGLNSGWNDYKDDAWSGEGISWFYNSATGYLRFDRPLEDAIWDPGWGENEEYGWHTGDTWNDLTAEQKQHGHTKNEFYNPSTQKFDFSYYMQTYHPGVSGIDFVVFNIGLNDVIWHTLTDVQTDSLLSKLDEMVASVHAYNANINVILCQVTPQPLNDAYTSNFGNDWLTAPKAKANQEKWNQSLLEKFDTETYRNAKVFIAPTAANFDAEHAIYTETIHPDKYDDSVTEIITNDIHPNEIGAKFIADTIDNTLIGLL